LSSPPSDIQSHGHSNGNIDSTETEAAGLPGHEIVEPGKSLACPRKPHGDTYDLLKGLVQDMFQQR